MINFNFVNGKILYDEFKIDFTKNFDEQELCLLEDLLQVKYGENYLIDIGWYPEFDRNGTFIINVIKDYKWDSPIVKKECKNELDLLNTISECVDLVESLCEIS